MKIKLDFYDQVMQKTSHSHVLPVFSCPMHILVFLELHLFIKLMTKKSILFIKNYTYMNKTHN